LKYELVTTIKSNCEEKIGPGFGMHYERIAIGKLLQKVKQHGALKLRKVYTSLPKYLGCDFTHSKLNLFYLVKVLWL